MSTSTPRPTRRPIVFWLLAPVVAFSAMLGLVVAPSAQAAQAAQSASSWGPVKVTPTHVCNVRDNGTVNTGNVVYVAAHYQLNPLAGAVRIVGADYYHGSYYIWTTMDGQAYNPWGSFQQTITGYGGVHLNPSFHATYNNVTAINYSNPAAGAQIRASINVAGGNLGGGPNPGHAYRASCAWEVSSTGVVTIGDW